MKKTDRIGLLLFRFTRKELTSEEERELTAWRYASAENDRLFHQETDPEYIDRMLSGIYESDEAALRRIIREDTDIPDDSSFSEKYRRIFYIVGLTLLVVFLMSASLYLLIHGMMGQSHPGKGTRAGLYRQLNMTGESTPNGKIIYHELHTERGEQMSIGFPDGTRIWLNAQSSLKYPTDFSKETIRLTLDGEAYFELASHAAKHFVISTPGNTIHQPTHYDGLDVIPSDGAHVNVKAYGDEPEIGATMLTGSATICAHAKSGQLQASIPLKQGEHGVFDGESLYVIPGLVLSEIIGWKNGRTAFQNAALPTVMRSLSRWYGVDVIYEGRTPDQKFNISSPLDAELSAPLSLLQKQGVTFEMEGKVITVNP